MKENTSEEARTESIAEESGDASRNQRLKVKFEFYGEDILEKIVKFGGNSGRVYLPLEWVGCRVKIIRTD